MCAGRAGCRARLEFFGTPRGTQMKRRKNQDWLGRRPTSYVRAPPLPQTGAQISLCRQKSSPIAKGGKGGRKGRKKRREKKGGKGKGRKGAWCLPKEIFITSMVLTSLARVNNLWFILGNRGRPPTYLLDAPSSKYAFPGLLRVEQIRLDIR